jgi:hypothetical protein
MVMGKPLNIVVSNTCDRFLLEQLFLLHVKQLGKLHLERIA